MIVLTLSFTLTITQLAAISPNLGVSNTCSRFIDGCDEVCGISIVVCKANCPDLCKPSPVPPPTKRIPGAGGFPIPPIDTWPHDYYPEEKWYILDGAKVYYFTGRWLPNPSAHQSDIMVDTAKNINDVHDGDYVILKIPSNLVVPGVIIIALITVVILLLTIRNVLLCSNKAKVSKGVAYQGVRQNSDTDRE